MWRSAVPAVAVDVDAGFVRTSVSKVLDLARDRSLRAEVERYILDAVHANRLATVKADAEFHGTIVEAARHDLVARTWRSLAPLQWLPRILSPDLSPLTPEAAATWVDRHQRLLDVIRSGDAEAAEAEVRTHVLRAGRVASPPSSAATASPA